MSRPKRVVLYVDDDEQILGMRKFLLETRGYRVLCAKDSEAALAIVRCEEIDLLLTDYCMPGMDGNELVRRAKELAPDLPAILISGVFRDVGSSLANAFVPKGSPPAELLVCMRAFTMRKRRPKKARIAAPEAVA